MHLNIIITTAGRIATYSKPLCQHVHSQSSNCEQFKIQTHCSPQHTNPGAKRVTHVCPSSSFETPFCPAAGDQVLAGHRRQSVHGAAEDGERKYNSGSESPARAAEHFSLSSQNSKTSAVSFKPASR